MAFTMTHSGLIVTALGVASYIFGIIAENYKPATGVVISGKDFVLCKYPKDPTVALGYLSTVFLLASSAAGFFFPLYPYKGKSIPNSKLFQSTGFIIFINIALFLSSLSLVFLLWPTITEQLHIVKNVHHNLQTTCPTAKTGLFGGGAMLALGASFMWLVPLMLAHNTREDYLDETEKDNIGDHNTFSNKA